MKATTLLERAVDAHPEYASALALLGGVYLKQARWRDAEAALHGAVELTPGESDVYANLALALHAQGRGAEAEIAGRRALDLESGSFKGAYALGMSLVSQNKNFAEALVSLQRASERFSTARFVAAQLLLAAGDWAAAESELRAYLEAGIGDPHNLELARHWLGKVGGVP